MRYVVVGTQGESLTIETDRSLSIAARLSLIEVFAKGAIAVTQLLVLDLLSCQKVVDFLALTGNFGLLLSNLFRLFFQDFRVASGQKAQSNKRSV